MCSRIALPALLLLAGAAAGQNHLTPPGSLNKPERIEWFRDIGFGLFIHWSVDSQTGVVISHSLAGADEAYTNRFYDELPKTFNPRKFYPQDWAALARLAGIRYVVFTAKHHSGFAMWNTRTTDFGVMQTPFRRDIVREALDAFRAQGIAGGLYFSPDDFRWLWKNKIDIQRNIPSVQPRANPGLMKLDQDQVRELMSNYGPIDVLFFDGEPQGLRELAWQLQPNVVVTRGAIPTPELYVPGIPLEGAWEACYTMGTAWQYQPQNETYKTGGQVIDLLIETRAKGGNLLLNVGPKPDGELPIEQEERLREIALWMQVNQEAIYRVRPWVITNEQNVWFTKATDGDTVYAIVKQAPELWARGSWKDFVLKSVQATDRTQVSVLGQNGRVLEYRPDVKPAPSLPTGRGWTAYSRDVYAAIAGQQPVAKSDRAEDHQREAGADTAEGRDLRGEIRSRDGTATLTGRLADMGNSAMLEVGFEYRSIVGLDASDRSIAWQPGPSMRMTAPGSFTLSVSGLNPDGIYEYRAWVKHPLLTISGVEKRLPMK